MILKNRGSDKLKNHQKSIIIEILAKSVPMRKVDGSRFFGPKFDENDQKWVYRDLWKNSPHKKHCAWARTPPWAKS
jgi:hypothetical protein